MERCLMDMKELSAPSVASEEPEGSGVLEPWQASEGSGGSEVGSEMEFEVD